MNKILIKHEADMLKLGAALAKVCPAKAIIFLKGPLGAGKTTLVRGFLKALGFSGHVKSPTYTLVETYSLAHITVLHFDLYRIQNPSELQFIGIEEYFSSDSVIFVEWPEQGTGWLPPPDLSCYIVPLNASREIERVASTSRGNELLQQWLSCD